MRPDSPSPLASSEDASRGRCDCNVSPHDLCQLCFPQDAEDLAKLTASLSEARRKNDELKLLAAKKAAHLKQKLDKVKVWEACRAVKT